jgi:hypothetical protein
MALRSVLLVLALVVISMSGKPVHSQTPMPSPANADQIRSFLNSDSFKIIIHRAFAATPAAVFQICPAMVSNGSSIRIVTPITFFADGKTPNGGYWKQSFPVSGCGDDIILNFFFLVTPDGKIVTSGALPGTTNADLRLQQGAMVFAKGSASLTLKDEHCEDFVVKNTKFESYLSINSVNSNSRPWTETWTVSGCNHVIDVPMRFTPDATGTGIHADPGIAKR